MTGNASPMDNASNRTLRMLIILAASSGLRLGEILGLNVSNVSEDGTVLTVVEKAFRSDVQDFLKTKNGKRLVDVDPAVGGFLLKFISRRKGAGVRYKHRETVVAVEYPKVPVASVA